MLRRAKFFCDISKEKETSCYLLSQIYQIFADYFVPWVSEKKKTKLLIFLRFTVPVNSLLRPSVLSVQAVFEFLQKQKGSISPLIAARSRANLSQQQLHFLYGFSILLYLAVLITGHGKDSILPGECLQAFRPNPHVL